MEKQKKTRGFNLQDWNLSHHAVGSCSVDVLRPYMAQLQHDNL